MGEKAKKARLKVLDMIYNAQTSHIGSNFSCIDLMAALFDRIDLDKDKFVLSAGWKAASLYYFLWEKDRITKSELDSYCKEGSKFIGLAEPIISDIPIAGGSMGLGLPGAIGIALAKKLNSEQGKVYVLMSDGELNCGTTWESALIASQHKLNNLVIILDYNRLQAMGKTEDILNLEPLWQKWISFGWFVHIIDGHNFKQIENGFNSDSEGKPKIIIAGTIKGKGVSFMMDNNDWHYRQIDKESYELAAKELR